MNTKNKTITGLTIGAIGVVFGDIGTSPLYAIQAIFGPLGQHLAITQVNVYGIISLVLWSVTLVVSIKYLRYIMRADNEGEGGIMALAAKIKSSQLISRYKWPLIMLGLAGVSLFIGDSAITPAISVLSAIEGLKVINPELNTLIVPLTLGILTLLFWLQRYGTGLIGRLFGPVMLTWFTVIAAGGAWRIWQHPDILHSLSPLAALDFVLAEPLLAFVAMGAVVLAITGAEALYADLGHFGRQPIARAWFLFVFPALALCYLGQGALLLHQPSAAANTFMLLFPEGLRLPLVFLAAFATLIASQAVISGAFSLTRQAVHLRFLPKMLIKHTSRLEAGQVYLPFVNGALFLAVASLVLLFGSSAKLSHAYGVAVSGTLAIDTILYLVLISAIWHKPARYVVLAGVGFGLIDLVFVSANLPKIWSGGWFPIIIASLVFLLMHTWVKGQKIISRERKAQEEPLLEFLQNIKKLKPPLTRVPGQAIYINQHAELTPVALRASVEKLRELHQQVVIVSVETTNLSHVPEDHRVAFDPLGVDDGVCRVTLSYGFHDTPNVPHALKAARPISPELDFDPDAASYFVSQSKIVPTRRHNMARWRKFLYAVMARNALSASDYFKLPLERTVVMQSLVEL